MKKLNPRPLLAFAHDIVAVGVAWIASFQMRFNFDVPPEFQATMVVAVGPVITIAVVSFVGFKLYRGLWRYASIHDLKLIAAAVATAALAVPALAVLLFQAGKLIPRSVYILYPIFLILFMGGSRLLYRAWRDRKIGKLGAREGKPVLILGAGDAAVSLLKDLAASAEWRVIGLLDDDVRKRGRQILGATVLGPTSTLSEAAHRYGVSHAIVAMPSATHQARKRIVDLCVVSGIRALTVPSFDDLMSGRIGVSQIRDVELDDLLGRDPVVLDSGGLHGMLGGGTIMVTGAGGSIGSELCRQIARFNPALIVLFEISEFALYRIEQEFRESFPSTPIVPIVGDVRNQTRLTEVLSIYRPTILFHAAAYKHVPWMEQDNAWEAVVNNALGTYVVAMAAKACEVKRFVLVSTDKAVNPTNVMGATKRVAEMICSVMQNESATTFIVVRFGNVLGSTGSVIPKFREQIARGGPVTVTHPEITRYFMSIPEAAQLVLQACLMGNGGDICVLDMGEPVRIVDLAKELIRLSGLREDDVRIQFTGLRPGEKLHEELLADDEETLPTRHAKLRVARTRGVKENFLDEFLAWTKQRPESAAAVRARLQSWIPEYSPAVAGHFRSIESESASAAPASAYQA